MYEFARRKAPEDAPNTAKIELIKTEVTLPWGVYKTRIRKICFREI
jgi:hypothetical protein